MKKSTAITISVIIVIVFCIIISIPFINNKKKETWSYKYGTKVIEILEYYKENKLEASEVDKQLKEIEKDIEDRRKEITDKNDPEEHKLFTIYHAAMEGSTSYALNKSISFLKIDEIIKKIKDIL